MSADKSGGAPCCVGCHGMKDAANDGLAARHRVARVGAGVAFGVIARMLGRRRPLRPFAPVAWWFAASHLVAGASGYPGCPELGAIPSLLAGRRVETRCGPWRIFDRAVDRVF